MAILINIEPAHECHEPLQKGMDAAAKGCSKYRSPYHPDTKEFDLWLLGFMAQKHGWIIEW